LCRGERAVVARPRIARVLGEAALEGAGGIVPASELVVEQAEGEGALRYRIGRQQGLQLGGGFLPASLLREQQREVVPSLDRAWPELERGAVGTLGLLWLAARRREDGEVVVGLRRVRAELLAGAPVGAGGSEAAPRLGRERVGRDAAQSERRVQPHRARRIVECGDEAVVHVGREGRPLRERPGRRATHERIRIAKRREQRRRDAAAGWEAREEAR